jgi:hypothetical protein
MDVCHAHGTPLQAPVSCHVDLCRYWLAKRGARSMPARSDIDPADIPALLPHIFLVHKSDGQFRFRLVGTAVEQQIGRGLTGDVVGSHVSSAPEPVAAGQAISERVFTTARPVFSTGQYETKWGTIDDVADLEMLCLDWERGLPSSTDG